MGTMSGKDALREIDGVLSQARGNLSSVDLQFGAARAELAKLKHAEVGVFASLAKLRLVAIEQGGLLDALNDADRKAEQILDERKAAAAKLDQDLQSAQDALGADEQRRGAQQSVVAAASEALDAAEAKAQDRLEADAAYQAQLKRTEQADFVADQAEDKAAAARHDRLEKGKPYEADPLFSYLWSRGYGTSAYRAWPLARWLDGKVAKLCAYEGARRNYALLIEIPARLAEHAATMRGQFETEAEALRALEEAAAEAAGVPDLKAKLDAAEKDLSDIDAAIDDREETIRGLTEQRKGFAAGEDSFYKRCIDVLSGAMRRESIDFLKARAARTASDEDDALVRRLAELGRDAERIEDNLDQFRRLHDLHNDRLQRLEDVRRRFKAARYDDPLSEFIDGALIALVLRQFLGGAVSGGQVWSTIRRQQRMRRVRADPNFGTLRFPRAPRRGPWHIPRGGGFGGGGFHGGGGFGGGGFHTGGGF
jgi:hypothetical protein